MMNMRSVLEWVADNGNNYARVYAERAMIDWEYWEEDDRHTQVLYILVNLKGCRVPGHKEVRQFLKEYVSEK
jgi:hypothetical protein